VADDADMGARVFYEMSAKLKRAGHSGRGGLRNQFHKDMREAAKPLLPAIRRQAAWRFARSGGLGVHMAKSKRYRTVAKTGLTTAGVSIRANKTDPRTDTRGRIAHPVPDGRGGFLRHTDGPRAGQRIMVAQFVPNAVGYFSETIEDRADLVRADLVRRLERWFMDTFAGDL
jgi:hypothetical protein